MFISQRFPDCHELRDGGGAETAGGQLFRQTVVNKLQLFLQKPDYFYMLDVALEAPERKHRKMALRERSRRRNGNPGE
jgi:hypothetical protein